MQKVPAILVGSGLGMLGALRLLHRNGIEAVCYGPQGIEAHSRWYRPVPGIAPGMANIGDLASYLAGSPLDSAVLIPCSDAASRAIAGLPPALSKRFPASTSSYETVARICDKGQFGELLETLDLPRPYTRKIERIEQLHDVPEHIFEAAFLKPRDSQKFCAQYGAKAVHVNSRAEAISKVAKPILHGHEMVLQEYVQGPASSHYLIDGLVDANGSIRAMLARQRLRMYPLDFGNSTYMGSIALDEIPEAVRSLTRLLQHVDYRGIFSAEFKRDSRDGQFKLIEINTRVWWFVEFAGRCGVDVCAMSYLDALGMPVPRVERYKVGARFVHPYFDYFACRALARAGEQSLAAGLATWVGAQQPHFNWLDASPALYDFLEHVPKRPTRPKPTLAHR